VENLEAGGSAGGSVAGFIARLCWPVGCARVAP
jgi:hypothetical protein